MGTYIARGEKEHATFAWRIVLARYVIVDSHVSRQSFDPYRGHATFVKNLIDQQPQISKALQDAITTVIGSHRDMVLFDFNQESIDTTFVDESLIDDAPVVAPPMPLPPVVEEKSSTRWVLRTGVSGACLHRSYTSSCEYSRWANGSA